MSVAGESGSGIGTSAIAQAPQTGDASEQVVAAPSGGNQEDGPPVRAVDIYCTVVLLGICRTVEDLKFDRSARVI